MVTRVWNAGGGRIQRTHCRRAWNEFIDRIQPSLTRLYPPPRGGDAWSAQDSLYEISKYGTLLEVICEKHSALFDDKRRMLRTAGEIADAARRVVLARREEPSAHEIKIPPLPLPAVELGQLRGTRLRVPEEEFSRMLLLQAVERSPGEPSLHPLSISAADIYARPELLRVLGEIPKEAVAALQHPSSALAYADDIKDPIRAAAILLQPPEINQRQDLDTFVAALENAQRLCLLGLIVNALDERLQRRVHAERSEVLGRLAHCLSKVTQNVDDLVQLGNRFAPEIRAIRDEARAVFENGVVQLDTRLAECWIEGVRKAARQLVTDNVAALIAEAKSRDDGADIRTALSQGHYGRAIRMLRGHAGTEVKASRQTAWRGDAEGNQATLKKNLDSSTDAKLKPLLDAWRTGVKGDSVRADRTLRTEFVRLFTAGRDLDRESAPAFIALPIAAINGDLTRDQLMPTWMPQLSKFRRLVVLTPPVSPEQPSFRHATLVRATDFPQDLVVFLAPRLPQSRREEVLAEVRRRGTAAAVVDDLDLLRLLNPGGQRPHLMLGLMEIVLEQQRRSAFSPFDLPEGSHVRLEMYVGRRDQARELARTANYSRLFSGRKLGKSALLRFTERTEGGTTLPSGNVLRVVYVPAVGIESEAAMADAILASLESALTTRFEPSDQVDPAEKVGALLRGYLEQHKTESLLVVLDEADVFVERQLIEYEERRERCLSFQMRSRFSELTDEQGLPRVRFVFAGYRVTNKSQGAWSNWGRVLFLDPLEPADAAHLISAPLAVMGIDVAAQADEIAYRCGYQPAILLRFGERLMEQLDQPHPSGRQVLSTSDLAKVFEDPRVQDEIRTITRNNFEGHPAALIVFGALLREFLEIPPGQAVRDAPQRVLERLRAIDDDTSWLERDGDGFAAIRTFLGEFVERSLLREHRSEGESVYYLRFPHHLTILSTLAEDARLREDIRRLRTRSESLSDQSDRALVSLRALRDLADASQPGSGAVGIIGSLWPTATYDRSGGIPDQLGITTGDTADASAILDGQRAVGSVRAIRRVDVHAAKCIIEELRTASVRPLLLGGLDLLRWGLTRRRAPSDLIFEVHGLARESMQRVAWWFHRVRGLEFVSTAAIERIYTRTGGLPLLLDIVDSQLSPAAGTTVADDRVALSLAAIDEAIPRIARDLCDGSPAIRLENREREILQMIECIVSLEASAGLDLASVA